MNITMMVGEFPSVSEQFIFNQIGALIDAGHNVRILASGVADQPDYGGVVAKYRLMERVRFANVPKSSWRRFITGVVKILKLLFIETKKTKQALNVDRYRTAASRLKTVFYLDLLRRDSAIEILHCHFGPMGLTGLFLKEVGLAERLAVTFHGSDINSYPLRHGGRVYHALWDNSDIFTANTTFTAGRMSDYGCKLSSIHVLPVGLETASFPVRNYVSDPKRFVLLFVGRMVEKKGLVYLIDALASLHQSVQGLECKIVGDGPLRSSLETYARQRNVHSVTQFLGAMPGHEVRDLYQTCDVFVLPSVTAANGDMEGQGLVLQEAQASGCPVISTLHNGIPDGVVDGETGLLVPEKDSAALANAILQFATRRELITKMGLSAATFARSRYDIAQLNEQLLSVYRRAIEENSARG